MAKLNMLAPTSQNALLGTPLLPVQTTQLTPSLERMYGQWVMNNKIPESNDYDMRGYFYDLVTGNKDARSGVNASDNELHFTDKWKLPNHPSFSSESLYSRTKQDPRWVENPAPYKEGTWALQNKQGNKVLEIPQ
jgi:hypothetical protein